MQCQRCLRGNNAHQRVRSDALDVVVCDACAEEAKRLGLATEAVQPVERFAGDYSATGSIAVSGPLKRSL